MPYARRSRAPPATTLAVDRTRLAHERTLMAWVRTATSMITFGFTIYKFFEEERLHANRAITRGQFGPRDFALLMIGIALVMLALATIQHHREMRELRRQYGSAIPTSLATVLAALIGGLGIVTLIVVGFRV